MSSGREGLPSALPSRENPTANALHVHCPRGHDGGGGPGSASPRRPSFRLWTQRNSQAPARELGFHDGGAEAGLHAASSLTAPEAACLGPS